MAFNFFPSVRFAFKEKPPSTKVNQVAENADYLYDRIQNGTGGAVYDSTRLGGLAVASYLTKADTVTGTISVPSSTSSWSAYITHSRGTQYPIVQILDTGTGQLLNVGGMNVIKGVKVEYSDSNRIRLQNTDAGQSSAFTVRYIIR